MYTIKHLDMNAIMISSYVYMHGLLPILLILPNTIRDALPKLR
jgi:hypothetical protein